MKFGYTILYVKDVKATLDFYSQVFGFKISLFHENDYGELITGDTKLAFASLDLASQSIGAGIEEKYSAKTFLPFEIGFISDNVEKDFKAACEKGATAVREPLVKPWGQTVSYVKDLNGFLVEICSKIEPRISDLTSE